MRPLSGSSSRGVKRSPFAVARASIRASHFDAFLGPAGLKARYLPLMPYVYLGLDELFALLFGDGPPPGDRSIIPPPLITGPPAWASSVSQGRACAACRARNSCVLCCCAFSSGCVFSSRGLPRLQTPQDRQRMEGDCKTTRSCSECCAAVQLGSTSEQQGG